MNSEKPRRRGFSALSVGFVLYLLAGLYWLLMFMSAGNEAKGSHSTHAVFVRHFLGMPLIESFRSEGRIGGHVLWGSLVLAILPVVVTTGLWYLLGRKPGRGR